MKDWWKVARWEIKRSIKDKTFLVISLLVPLLILAGGVLPPLLAEKGAASQLTMVIRDDTGMLEEALEERLFDTRFQPIEKAGSLEEMQALVREGELDLILHIPREYYKTNQAFVYFKNLNTIENGALESILSDLTIDYRLRRAGLEPDKVKEFVKPVKLKNVPLSQKGKSSIFSMFLPLILAGMMLFASIFSGSMLMQSIIKEKNDRVVEIVLSSISSNDLITGKVVGYGILGLLQIALWAGVGAAVSSYFLDFSLAPLLDGKIMVLFLYFLLGYFLIAGMYSLLGATIKDPQTGSQSMGLVVIIPIIPIWFVTLIMKNPHGLVSRILSYFPLTAPNTMLLRSGVAEVPLWEVGLTVFILIVFDILLVKFAAKIFRVGMLMYGKSATPKEIIRWAKLKI